MSKEEIKKKIILKPVELIILVHFNIFEKILEVLNNKKVNQIRFLKTSLILIIFLEKIGDREHNQQHRKGGFSVVFQQQI